MSSKVVKLIIVTNDDTAGMITEFSELPLKKRDDPSNEVAFTFFDKNGLEHPLHLVHAEEV